MVRVALLCMLVAGLMLGCSGDDGESRVSASPTASSNAFEPTNTHSPTPERAATATVAETSVPSPAAASTTPTRPSADATPTVPLASWGNSEVYVMRPDGSDQRNVTDEPAHHSDPACSPDGTRIAFVTMRGIETVIAVMAADGSNAQILSEGRDRGPAWSPDGTLIAFTSDRDGHTEIYIMSADGEDERRVTSSELGSSQPNWSPDGSTIAYVGYLDGHEQLMLMDADGGNQRHLIDSPSPDFSPAWSPDGTRIAFVRSVDAGNLQIHAVNADGSDVRNLSSNEFYEHDPAWSPDGRSVAFARGDFLEVDIFVMNADGTNVRQLTGAPRSDTQPAWSPDGSLIAFTSNRDGGQPVECSWIAQGDIAAVESVEALAWMAHQIVVGTVVEQLPPMFGEPESWGPEPSLPIYTDYLFEVEQRFRGHPVETVRIRQAGGKIGDCEQIWEGQASLPIGERLLLFLTEGDWGGSLPDAYYITGSSQGLWTIAQDGTVHTSTLFDEQYEEHVGLPLDEFAAVIAEALAGDPPPGTFQPVPPEDAPPA